MNELVVISGKGGTGKTSILASFAVLAENIVIGDCDVDAADLYLLLEPDIQYREEFRSGHEALIRTADCTGCLTCKELCRYGAIRFEANGSNGGGSCIIDPLACEGCGVCVHFCPEQAIDFPESICGEWYISSTRAGPMVHARLGIAAENSGKLVTTVRQQTKVIAEERGCETILIDGPPGIGCPVIASLTGADSVLVVTEPTLSGEHDLLRVLSLCRHFEIPASVCVNKWDLNREMTIGIEERAGEAGAAVAGRVRYDNNVTKAQIDGRTAVEANCEAGEDIKELWQNIRIMENKTTEPETIGEKKR